MTGHVLPFGRRRGGALRVACPRCGARVQQACVTASQFMPAGFIHPERRHAAGRPGTAYRPPSPQGGDAA